MMYEQFQISEYENTAVPGSKDYSDRADKRRKEVGSSHHREKTESASLQKAIPVGNKGFKMLSKLGWSEGQSLGKSDSGIKEPVIRNTLAICNGVLNICIFAF
jgi:G-patch domain